MSKVIIVWILFGITILLGLVISIVLLEKYLHTRKQKKYDDLHARMGLESNDHEYSLRQQLESKK